MDQKLINIEAQAQAYIEGKSYNINQSDVFNIQHVFKNKTVNFGIIKSRSISKEFHFTYRSVISRITIHG